MDMDSRLFSEKFPSFLSSSSSSSSSTKSSSTHPLTLNHSSTSSELNLNKSFNQVVVADDYSLKFASKLFLFITLLGTTFRGCYFNYFCHSKIYQNYLKWLSYLYELITFIGLLLFMQDLFNTKMFQTLFSHSNKTYTMTFVFKLAGFCLLLEQIVMKSMTLLNGPNILNIVHEIAKNCHWKHNERIRNRLLYFYILFQLFGNIFGSLSISIFVGHSFKKKLIYFVCGIIFSSNKLSVTLIHFFVSILINHRIQGWKNRFYQYKNYSLLLLEIIEQRNHMKELNKQLSLMIFVKLISNSIELAAIICILEDLLSTGQDFRLIFAIICYLLTTWFELFAECYTSQSMHDQMNDFIESTQNCFATMSNKSIFIHNDDNDDHSKQHNHNRLTNNNTNTKKIIRSMDDDEYRCLDQISRLEENFYFSTMGFIVLKNSILLTIMGNVFSFAILLIQTK